MTTLVTIKNCNELIISNLKELTLPIDGEFQVSTIDIINRMYNTEYHWDGKLSEGNWPSKQFMDDNIGSKWILIEDAIFDETECSFTIETAWDVPIPFLENLANKLGMIQEDCYIVGTYEDEMYEPIGAFVFGKNYDDIEDYEDVDKEKMWDDDDYRESIFNELRYNKDSLELAFLEYLTDKKNNPQDYE